MLTLAARVSGKGIDIAMRSLLLVYKNVMKSYSCKQVIQHVVYMYMYLLLWLFEAVEPCQRPMVFSKSGKAAEEMGSEVLHKRHNSKEFLMGNTVVVFGFCTRTV